MKLFTALLLGALSAISLFGVEGTIAAIKQYPSSTQIVIQKSDGTVVGGPLATSLSSEAQKKVLAIALTAQSSGKTVDMRFKGDGWNAILIK